MDKNNRNQGNLGKIAYTALHLNYGGVELAIAQQVNYLVNLGYDVEIFCTYNLGKPAYFIDDRVKIRYLTAYKPNRAEFNAARDKGDIREIFFEGMKALKILFLKRYTMIRAIKSLNEGVLVSTRHEHTVLMSKYASERVQKVAQLHHDHAFAEKLIKSFLRDYKKIDDFVLLLPSLRAEISKIMQPRNPRTRLWSIGNFLSELPKGEADKNAGNEADGGDNSPKKWWQRDNKLIWIGRLSPEKGIMRLMPIMVLLKERLDGKIDNWSIDIFGDGEERERFLAAMAELELDKHINFHGVTDRRQIMDALAKSKAMLMTSHTEGFSFVILEAASMGTPIIAYDVRMAPRDLIRNMETGFLVKNDNYYEMVKSIEKIFTAESAGEAWTENLDRGLADFVDVYSEDKIMKMWRQVFALGPNNLHKFFRKLYLQDMNTLVKELAEFRQNDSTPVLVVTVNPEIMMQASKSETYGQILTAESTIIIPDGIGVVKAAKLLGYACKERLPGIELVEKLLVKLNSCSGKLFLYGAKPEVMEKLKIYLQKNFPQVNIVGAYHGYNQDEEFLLEEIGRTQPALVLAALGAPRQEEFLAKCRGKLTGGVLIGVGGTFDVLSGCKKRAPHLWRKLNLEWAYRLLSEPQRLRRFLAGNLRFVGMVLKLCK